MEAAELRRLYYSALKQLDGLNNADVLQPFSCRKQCSHCKKQSAPLNCCQQALLVQHDECDQFPLPLRWQWLHSKQEGNKLWKKRWPTFQMLDVTTPPQQTTSNILFLLVPAGARFANKSCRSSLPDEGVNLAPGR
jgi:hypothetical protein